jgi:hypothetical protein
LHSLALYLFSALFSSAEPSTILCIVIVCLLPALDRQLLKDKGLSVPFAACCVPSAWHSSSPFSCLPPGLPHRPHYQRQCELLPHIQEDVPAQARPHGHQPCGPPRPRGLSPSVLTPLSQRVPAHVSCSCRLAEP